MSLHRQDFLMRQIQFLTQILQHVIFKKDQNRQEEAKQEIEDAFRRLTKDHPKEFHELTLEETISYFQRPEKFQSELAVAVADLLVEEGNIRHEESLTRAQKCYAQALALYRKTLEDDAAAVPLEIHDTIDDLTKKLTHSDYLEDVNTLFES